MLAPQLPEHRWGGDVPGRLGERKRPRLASDPRSAWEKQLRAQETPAVLRKEWFKKWEYTQTLLV